jgi:hypothetical protein
VDISDVTKKPKTISNHEKAENPTPEKKRKTRPEYRTNVQFGQQH